MAFSGLVSKSVACAAVLASTLAAQSPVGRLTTIDGRVLDGTLTVTADGVARVAGEAPGELAYAAVVSFESAAGRAEVALAPHRVWLRSGLELPAMTLAGRPGGPGQPPALVVTLPGTTVLEVPLGAIAAFRQGGTERPEPPSFSVDRADPPLNQDLLHVLKDGKPVRSSVAVTGFGAGTLDFELRGKEYDFAFEGVTGVVFGKNTGFAADRQPRPRTTVALATGERLEGRLLSLSDRCRLRLDEGIVVDVPSDTLLRLEVASDQLLWLGELTPKVEQVPAFDRVWPWLVDRCHAGPGLVLGGKTFSRGLCLVPRTRLTYELPGAFDWFEAVVGIDDRAGPQAHADFRVLADGQELLVLRGRIRGMPPESVRVPLTGKRSLVIEVDFGKNYDLGDYCVFAAARVVRL
jgi:hypothetical protein